MNLKEQKRLEDTWKALEVTLMERASIVTRSKFANEQSELLTKEINDGNFVLCNETKINVGTERSFIFVGVRTMVKFGEYKINYYLGNCLEATGIVVDKYDGFKYHIDKEIVVFLGNDGIASEVLDVMDGMVDRKVLNYKTSKKLLSGTDFSPSDIVLNITPSHWKIFDHEIDHIYQDIINLGGDVKDSLIQKKLPWVDRHEEVGAEINSKYNVFKRMINSGNDINEFWPNTVQGYDDIINHYFPHFHDSESNTRKKLLKRLYQLREELKKIQDRINDKKSRGFINKAGKTK